MADDTSKKQYDTIESLINAIDAESDGASAKDRAASIKKTAENQAELLKVFEGGIPANLGAADKKALVSAVQSAGIEITDKDEDRGVESERFLLDVAFKSKKDNLVASKKLAKEEKDLTAQAGLHMKGLWMDASNKITNGILDLKEWMHDKADVTKLSEAFKQDFSVLTMAFQEIGNLPGMKIIVASLQYLAAWAGRALLPLISAIRTGFANWRKDLFSRRKAKEEDKWVGLWERMFGKKTHEQVVEGKKEQTAKGIKNQEKAMWKEKEVAEGLEKKARQNLGERGIPDMFPETLWQKISRKFYEIGDNIKTGTGKIAGSVKGIFINKETNELTKVGKFFKKAQELFLNGLRLLVKGFMRAAKAITTVVKRFAIVMAQFLFQVGLFIAGLILAIAGFIIANLPLIALIALVVLIAVGLFFLVKYLMDNWEKIKVKFTMAVDKFKNAFTKMSNWFTDLGEDIVYKIKWLIAKIKDGIASMANKVITKVNKIPGVNIEKWDQSRTEKLEGEREDVLGGRIDRDQKLLGEYKSLSQERGKQLEDAAKTDAERKADKDAGLEGGSQQINTSVQTDAREIHMSSESTQPTDFRGMQANQALDG